MARKLNIDCAPAMIGWAFDGGRPHPEFDGFVVCEEFQDTLIGKRHASKKKPVNTVIFHFTKKNIIFFKKLNIIFFSFSMNSLSIKK